MSENPVLTTEIEGDVAVVRMDDGKANAISMNAVAALGAALVAQYVFDLRPCVLCVYQRWAYVAAGLAGIAALTILRAPGRGQGQAILIGLAALAFAAGAAIAGFHVGVEQGWFEGLAACAGAGETPTTLEALRAELLEGPPPPRCDEPAWTLFGISMAGYNVIYAAVLAGFSGAAAVIMAMRARA